MQGTVNRIWHNRREDGSEYWVVSIDGQRYSTWDGDMLANVHQGDSVEFAFARSGHFRNLTALKPVQPAAFVTADTLQISAESLRIVRMNCLRTAAEMLKDTTYLPEQKVALAIEMAAKLEGHVLNPLTKCTTPQEGEQAEHHDADDNNTPEGAK